MTVIVAVARDRDRNRRVPECPALRDGRVTVRMAVVTLAMALRMRMAVTMCVAMIVTTFAVTMRFTGVLVVMIVNGNIPLGPGHRPEHAGSNHRDDHERDAAGQHEWMELLAEQAKQHTLLQKIHAQANDAERSG